MNVKDAFYICPRCEYRYLRDTHKKVNFKNKTKIGLNQILNLENGVNFNFRGGTCEANFVTEILKILGFFT